MGESVCCDFWMECVVALELQKNGLEAVGSSRKKRTRGILRVTIKSSRRRQAPANPLRTHALGALPATTQPDPALAAASHPIPMALSLSLAPPVAAAAATVCNSTSLFLRPPLLTMSRRRLRVVAMADLLGDLGARDPFPEEIESKFGEKVLGNVDTLHQILIPTLSALSLARLPLQPDAEPLSLDDARRLLFKVVGWRLLLSDGEQEQRPARLQGVWKVRDEPCGQELVARINAALDGAGHAPAALVLEAPDKQVHQVRAELSTPSAAGDSLTLNDFIVAARIDKVKTLDLIPKKRVWA